MIVEFKERKWMNIKYLVRKRENEHLIYNDLILLICIHYFDTPY